MTEISRRAQTLFDEFAADPRLATFISTIRERISAPGPKEQLLTQTEATIRTRGSSRAEVAQALSTLLDLAKGEQ